MSIEFGRSVVLARGNCPFATRRYLTGGLLNQ
jgi:hypothetical protein